MMKLFRVFIILILLVVLLPMICLAQASYLKADEAETVPRSDSDALPTVEKYNNFHEGTWIEGQC